MKPSVALRTTPAALHIGLRAYWEQDLERASNAFRQTLQDDPECHEAASHLLLLSLYDGEGSAGERFAAHAAWGRQWKPGRQLFRRPGSRLRVGYVRKSLTADPGGSFLRPIIRNHDSSRVIVFAYSEDPADEALPATWRCLSGMAPEGAVSIVARDRLDVLVNIDGHFSYRTMRIFARQAAPVQVSMCNYPVTTGLKTVHFRFSDEIADPLPSSSAIYTEQVVHLPVFLPFDPPPHSPAATGAPSARNGFVTFGCFNNPLKITSALLDVCARTVAAVPHSRFLFHHPFLCESDGGSAGRIRPAIRARLLEPFLRHNIEEHRVAFLGALAAFDHLDLHNEVDILFDSHPYSGLTTTFEAMWMGVPVVTTGGDSFLARATEAILRRLELSSLVADSLDGMSGLACQLAKGADEAASLRQEIAARFRASAFLQHREYVRAMEAAYFQFARKTDS